MHEPKENALYCQFVCNDCKDLFVKVCLLCHPPPLCTYSDTLSVHDIVHIDECENELDDCNVNANYSNTLNFRVLTHWLGTRVVVWYMC